MRKGLLAVIACFALSVSLLAPATAFALDGVAYIDESGTAKTQDGVSELASGDTAWGTAATTTWYVAMGSLGYADRIDVVGDVRLILADGCTLSANSGIRLASGNSLTVYAQTGGTGTLDARSESRDAAIGGNGAPDFDYSAWAEGCGTLKLNGGTVSAENTQWGAAVGGGGTAFSASRNGGGGGSLTMTGGVLTARNSGDAATIGGGTGGQRGGGGASVEVSGGVLTVANGGGGVAIGGGAGDGIGVGEGHSASGGGGSLTMTGGILKATSASFTAIGGGKALRDVYYAGGATTVTFHDFEYEWSNTPDVGSSYVSYASTPYVNDTGSAKGIRPATQYAFSVTPATLDFGAKTEGYATRPDAQTLVVTNRGNTAIHPVALANTSGYEYTTPSDWTDALAAGATRSFTVQPKLGAALGDRGEALTVSTTEGCSADATLAFSVNPAITLAITGDTTIVSGTSTTLSADANGGTGTYSYQWSGGGISDTTQSVTVSPTATTAYTVTVADQGEGSATASATVTVIPVAPSITTTALPDASLGAGYGNGATLAASGTTPITWSLTGSLPPGLALDADTGAISGIPTLEGTYTFTATATNAVGTDSRELSITVAGIEYQFTKGQNGEWAKGGTSGLGFENNGPHARCTGVLVDGVLLTGSQCTVASVSSGTSVTLSPGFLETLALGSHSLRVNYSVEPDRVDDGYAKTSFTVKAASPAPSPPSASDPKSAMPRTGDEMQLLPLSAIALLAGVVVPMASALHRKRHDS